MNEKLDKILEEIESLKVRICTLESIIAGTEGEDIPSSTGPIEFPSLAIESFSTRVATPDVPETDNVVTEAPVTVSEDLPETEEDLPEAEPVAEPEPEVVPEVEPVAEPEPEVVPEVEAVTEPEPATEDLPEDDDFGFGALFSEDDTIGSVLEEPEVETPAKPVPTTIDCRQYSWYNDMPGASVKNIRTAISLYDRALFINTLFKEDFMNYDKTITELNECSNLAEAIEYVLANFPNWNLNSDVVYGFMMAIRRKLK